MPDLHLPGDTIANNERDFMINIMMKSSGAIIAPNCEALLKKYLRSLALPHLDDRNGCCSRLLEDREHPPLPVQPETPAPC
jgi:hypothetical protein